MIRIVGISGSLRAASSNTALLRAAADLAPPGVQLTLFTGLGDLPLFNPDVERIDAPALRNIITVMGARVVDAASLTVPLTNNRIDALEARARPDVAAVLQAMLAALAAAVAASAVV